MSEKGRVSHINIVQVKPYIFTTVLHDSIALTLSQCSLPQLACNPLLFALSHLPFEKKMKLPLLTL